MTTTIEHALEIVETGELGAHRDAWDRLALQAPVPSPFLQSWWLEGTGGRHDHYLLVLDGDTLVGGLALERRRFLGVDHFRILSGGKLCPDHTDLVARPEREDDVVAAIRGWFAGPGARVLDLEGVVADSRIARALAPARVTLLDVAPHERLTGTSADYLAARSKTFRKRVSRFQRAADSAGLRCRRLGPDEIEAGMDAFEALHGVRPDRRELVRELPRIRRAVLLGAARDQVRLYVGELDGRTGAVLMLFSTGQRLSVYQTARSLDRDFNHVGTVVDMLAIEHACAEGMGDLDFLRGSEQYKRSFVSEERSLLRVRAAHGLRGRLALVLLLGLERLRTRVGELAPVRGISKKLRRTTDQTAGALHQ